MLTKYKAFLLTIAIPATIVFQGCQEFNPPVIVPCYGHVDSISYRFDSLSFKENSRFANIIDAWVYLDNNPIGAFQMPCTFPMIADNGVHTIKIFPGILEGGIPILRSKYPYYSYYTINVNLTQGQTVKFTPSVTYAPYAKFAWTENFESGCTITSKNVLSDTVMFRNNTGAFEGSWDGAVILDSTNPTFYRNSYQGISDTMTLPKDGSTGVFLEINYNSNALLMVGLYATDAGNHLGLQLPPVEYAQPTGGVWHKLYISLEQTLARNPNGEPFTIYFMVQRPSGMTSAYMYIDNIKLVD